MNSYATQPAEVSEGYCRTHRCRIGSVALAVVDTTAGFDVAVVVILSVVAGICVVTGIDVTGTAVTVGVAAAEVPVELVHPAATMRRKQVTIKRTKDLFIFF
ncbi:hypothetical protein [Methanoregula sp. UBA64]|uniref:hypothetical protein n=1 Tax=Methanoregula sp. UBA64 TaxID=1915554 RepID=UPI0025F84DF2|nr:hypothetical protein [Methanoregula sp. UBA64]